jgi:Helix-turn-helix of DDE superfamily endonuclease
MRYETIQHLKDTDFKRLTGVQRETFEKMLTVVEKGSRDFGRPTKLSRADQLLMTLMYWREYRTEFHIAQSYGISEATVCRTIRKVENALVLQASSVCQARRHSNPVRLFLKWCWWMSVSNRLSVQKKPKTALQRQKEATYSKSAGNG